MASTQVLAGFHAVVARLRAPDSIKEIYVEASRRESACRRSSSRPSAPAAACIRSAWSAWTAWRAAPATRAWWRWPKRQLAVDVDEVLDVIEGPPLLLILDGVTDPHNLGACLRPTRPACAVIAPRTARWA